MTDHIDTRPRVVAHDPPEAEAGEELPAHVAALMSALSQRRPGIYERWVKPAIDRVLGLILLLVLLPVMALVAVAVAIQLGSPILLRQARVGRDGRIFHIYKFRTMRPDRRQRELDPDDVPEWDGRERRMSHKVPHDPRLVPVGRFLRRWSLDELPQLINVVRGDMSLVGPRPEMVAIVQRYERWQHLRHMVKPGVSGLWQVSTRGDGMMHEHVDVDLEYIVRLSPWQDLKILLLTVPVALGLRRGY